MMVYVVFCAHRLAKRLTDLIIYLSKINSQKPFRFWLDCKSLFERVVSNKTWSTDVKFIIDPLCLKTLAVRF